MKTLTLQSPLAGWVMPLEEVPDAAFAQRMVGDGVAIDPTDNVLRAPCAGEILPPQAGSPHAVRLRADSGEEILMHIGIDTVGLRGEGFAPLVHGGERVVAGQPLLRFDLDLVARRASSTVTPILVAAGLTPVRSNTGKCLAAGDFLMEIAAVGANSQGVMGKLTGWMQKGASTNGASK